MNRRLMGLVGGLASLGLVTAGCGSASEGGGAAGDDYKVVVLGGLSAEGVLADNASTSVLSAKAGVAAANASGGIDGRNVTIEVIDDQADPTTAVTKLREVIAKNKPDLVLNSGPSTVADATLPILKQNNILSFNIGPTATSADPAQFPLNFDLSANAADYINAFVPYLEEHGYKKVGILHGSSSYGETFGKTAQEIIGKSAEVVANEEYDVAALDMTAQIQAIKSKNPDALILDAYGAPLGYVLKGIDKLGWDIPIVGNNSVAATGLISTEPPAGVLGTDQVKNLVMQVYASTAYDQNATEVVEAVKHMKDLGEIKASLILAYNYDAPLLVQAAAKQAGSTDPAELAKALEDPEVQKAAPTAIISTYNFTAEQHGPHANADEFAFISPSPLKDGQFHPQGS